MRAASCIITPSIAYISRVDGVEGNLPSDATHRQRSEKSTRRRVTPREKKKQEQKHRPSTARPAPIISQGPGRDGRHANRREDARGVRASSDSRAQVGGTLRARAAQFEADGDRIRAVVGDVAQRVGTRVGAAAAWRGRTRWTPSRPDAAVCAALAQRQAALVKL